MCDGENNHPQKHSIRTSFLQWAPKTCWFLDWVIISLAFWLQTVWTIAGPDGRSCCPCWNLEPASISGLQLNGLLLLMMLVCQAGFKATNNAVGKKSHLSWHLRCDQILAGHVRSRVKWTHRNLLKTCSALVELFLFFPSNCVILWIPSVQTGVPYSPNLLMYTRDCMTMYWTRTKTFPVDFCGFILPLSSALQHLVTKLNKKSALMTLCTYA